jgi:hypothetical protein
MNGIIARQYIRARNLEIRKWKFECAFRYARAVAIFHLHFSTFCLLCNHAVQGSV